MQNLSAARARRDGLSCVLLGSAIFLLLGTLMTRASSGAFMDFKTAYFSAAALLQHGDPYDPGQVQQVYRSQGFALPSDTDRDRQIVTRNVYLPSEFAATLPFALFPFAAANLLWMAATAASLILASLLMWEVAAQHAPVLAGLLTGFFLANCELLPFTGNPAGLAVGLCVIAVWCLLRERFVPAGVLSLALSLCIKPHDAGLVWLYFLLAGGSYRRRAWQTLAVAAALALPAALWVAHVSPHWVLELRSNMQAFYGHGGINDPGPASSGARGLLMITNLQTVFAFLRDDPRFYNWASFLVAGPLLLLWMLAALRSRAAQANAWLAVAAIAPLSMLPIYHRQYDAKLLVLTVPACAILWARHGRTGRIGRLALLVTAAGIVLNGDLAWILLIAVLGALHLAATGLPGAIARALLVLPVPLMLLTVGCFYLWACVREAFSPPASRKEPSIEPPS